MEEISCLTWLMVSSKTSNARQFSDSKGCSEVWGDERGRRANNLLATSQDTDMENKYLDGQKSHQARLHECRIYVLVIEGV
jgi:hypothetical protein